MDDRLTPDLLRRILLHLRASDDEDVSGNVVAVLCTSKGAYERLRGVHVLRGTYGHGRLLFGKRYPCPGDGYIDMGATSCSSVRPRTLYPRASKLTIQVTGGTSDPVDFADLLSAFADHPHVAISVYGCSAERQLVFPAMAGLRVLRLSHVKVPGDISVSVLFPQLFELQVDDMSWWHALRANAPHLRKLAICGETDADHPNEFYWNAELQHVSKLQQFVLELNTGVSVDDFVDLYPVVVTSDILAATTPGLTSIVLGPTWCISSTPGLFGHQLPSLDPAIFRQVTYLKMYRMHWPGAWDEYQRGVRIAELQHLKHFAVCAYVMYVDSMSDIGVITAVEKLTIVAESIIQLPQQEPAQQEPPQEAPAVDLRHLQQLCNLRRLALLDCHPAEFEDDDESQDVWASAGVDMLTEKGCTVLRNVRPHDEFWMSSL